MSLLLKSFTLFAIVNGVQMQQLFGGPPFCLNQDVNGGVCDVIENFFAYPPFQQVADLLASSLTEFTTVIQIREILDYITQSFGANPLNITNYESMSQSFNLVIFEPCSNRSPRNISVTDVLNSCDALGLHADSAVKIIWPGYGDNCNNQNPLETFIDWTPDEMQQFADISDSTVMVVEWGFRGLSCYGYIQITLCLISKIAELFAYLLNECVAIERLDLIGHSMGAQVVGYISQLMAANGRRVNRVFGLDPAGPGFQTGLRCQGIQSGFTMNSMIIHTNPCQLGTCDFNYGDINVLVNPNRGYCQPNCTCFLNPSCSHSYSTILFLKLALNEQLPAIYTQFNPIVPGLGEPRLLTIYQNIPNGYYVLNTYT